MWAANFNLGYMYYQQGDLDSAIHYLSRTAAGDPTNSAAIFYLGLADLKLHRWTMRKQTYGAPSCFPLRPRITISHWEWF